MKTITTDGLKALQGKNGDLTLVNTLGRRRLGRRKFPERSTFRWRAAILRPTWSKKRAARTSLWLCMCQPAMRLLGEGGPEAGSGGIHRRVPLHRRCCGLAEGSRGIACQPMRLITLPGCSEKGTTSGGTARRRCRPASFDD